MGILSISMNGIYITLGVVIFLTLVGAINSLAECLNRRHNDGGESPNTFENITQSADARPRKLNIRHSLKQRTGKTTITSPENLNEIELSPAAEDIDSGDQSLRKIGTSNKTNFHPTLSSAMRYDDSSDEEDYGSPAILSSENDASGTPEVDPKALIAENFAGIFQDVGMASTPPSRSRTPSVSPVPKRFHKPDNKDKKKSSKQKESKPASLSQMSGLPTHTSPRSSTLRKPRRRKRSNSEKAKRESIRDEQAAVNSDPATGEAASIQKQHRRIYSLLHDFPRRVVHAIIYHPLFSVTITVTVVAAVIFFYKFSVYGTLQTDDDVNNGEAKIFNNGPNLNEQADNVVPWVPNESEIDRVTLPKQDSTSNTTEKRKDTNVSRATTADNRNSSKNNNRQQEQNRSQDEIQSQNESKNQDKYEKRNQELGMELAERSTADSQSTTQQQQFQFIHSSYDWLRGVFMTYIWNSENISGILYALEHVAFLSPLTPDAWVYVAQHWQWAPMVTWLCGIVVLRQLLCCHRKPKGQEHEISIGNLGDKIHAASSGFGEEGVFDAMISLLVILSSAKDEDRDDTNHVRSVVDLLRRTGAINADETAMLLAGCNDASPRETN